MARRYSGSVTVYVQWLDEPKPNLPHGGHYKCGVVTPNGRRTIIVGAPQHITQGVDSPEAYDDTARAALSFAADEDSKAVVSINVERYAAYDGSDWYVSRSPILKMQRALANDYVSKLGRK